MSAVFKEDAMPRTKVVVPNVAEAEPGLWSNGIRGGDLLFISGHVARPFKGGKTLVEVRSLAGSETLVEIEAVAYLGKQ